jgi:hypothetical protein
MAYSGPPIEHPLVRELKLMARRADQDPPLRGRYDSFRKAVAVALGRREPGAVARLVRAEIAGLNDLVLVEARQWREAADWADHKRYWQAVRAAANFLMFLQTTGLRMAGEE